MFYDVGHKNEKDIFLALFHTFYLAKTTLVSPVKQLKL